MPLYFAYGSNLSLDQMKRRCPGSEMVDVGYIEDHELGFTAFASRWNGGVADIIERKGSVVWGLVYSITIEDLSHLDYFEGHPTFYNRKKVKVHGREGMHEDVWTYYVIDKKDFIPPTMVYFELIYEAGKLFDFPVDYLRLLEQLEARIEE